MSNRVYESFLKSGLPKRPDGKSYSPTAYNVYRTICYRYNEKTGTAYPGEKELILISGVSRQSVNRALKELKGGGIIDQPKAGYRNQRAEFRPVYHLTRLLESDNPALHIKERKESGFQLESDVPVIEKSKASDEKVSRSLVPISTISNSKYVKYSINELRFNQLLEYIPKEFRSYIKPGKNYEKRLDELERKGTYLTAVGEYLAKQNWSTSFAKGGLLESFLDVLLGVKKVGESSSMPKWCGGDYCDQVTRLWPEPSMGKDGRLTYECITCHPNQLGKNDFKMSPAGEINDVLNELSNRWTL
jgi:hypothetical protein